MLGLLLALVTFSSPAPPAQVDPGALPPEVRALLVPPEPGERCR